MSHLTKHSFRARVLVASSCASMGADVRDVRAVVNVGKPSSDWIMSKQMGRAGRDGKQAVTINMSRPVKSSGVVSGVIISKLSFNYILQGLMHRGPSRRA